MTYRTIARSLACLLILMMLFHLPAFANSKLGKKDAQTQKIKAGIAKLGIGQSSRVKLKLSDKTVLAGYISEVGNDSFVVTDSNSGVRTTVAYPDVVQVKGNNLSTRTKVIIGVAIAVGVAITLYLVRGAFCDGC